MPKRTIEDLVSAKYADENVAEHVLKAVHDANTADKILSGELVLPSEHDATRNYQIATGQFAATPNEAKLRDENNSLRARLDAIEQRLQQPQPAEGK